MKSALWIVLLLATCRISAQAFPPYYDISDRLAAQAEARARTLPLVWVGGFPEDLTVASPIANSSADLLQMAMKDLDGKAVIVFFNGHNMDPVPVNVHAQFHIKDDGPLDGIASWDTPKIVFTTPEVRRTLGRVSSTQMKQGREVPIDAALQVIKADPTDMVVPPPAETPTASASTDDESDATIADLSPTEKALNYVRTYKVYLILVGIGLVAFALLFGRKRDER